MLGGAERDGDSSPQRSLGERLESCRAYHMSCHYLEKQFSDYADDIEGVNIHYICTPLGGVPDWENQRATRYMPVVQSSAQLRGGATAPSVPSQVDAPASPRLRKKILKLPQQIADLQSNALTGRYLLHYYFEIFQDGHRHYSSLYTEEVVTAGEITPSG
jgi:hypothetical protein